MYTRHRKKANKEEEEKPEKRAQIDLMINQKKKSNKKTSLFYSLSQ
jgi:hypothetical protein